MKVMGDNVGRDVMRGAEEEPVAGFPSRAMQDFLTALGRVALTELPVVIAGERGSGKEWAARLLHRLSPRAPGPFVSVDCGAGDPADIERRLYGYETIAWSGVHVEPGAFEEAARGTLHCNDAGCLSASALHRIARTADYRKLRRMGGDTDLPADARLVLTFTLEEARPAELPQAEPWYRISPITLVVPPLRARPEDVPVYAEAFMADLRSRHGLPVRSITKDALDILAASSWPGNVRGLKNALEYAAIMGRGETIQPEHLPASLLQRADLKSPREI